METRQIAVQCECGSGEPTETLGSLMGKINASVAELSRTLAMSPTDFLSRSLYRTEACTKCDGQGFLYQQNGPDDLDKEECRVCNGSGRVIL